nr:chaperone protein DnaJ 20, chloroplastic-like [Ipomoea batatas]
MCCNSHGLTLSRSDPRFSYLSIIPSSRPDPRRAVFFPVRLRHPRLRARTGRIKSKLNDAVSVAEPKSFYDLLGIPETGSLLEIKQAYKQLARKYHPDVSPPDRVEEYTQRFIQVQEAYETLSDPRRRALYDSDMAKGLHFAFSARRRCQSDEYMEEKSEWKGRWQSQLSELKRRSMHKDSGDNLSWGARMRRQRNNEEAS